MSSYTLLLLASYNCCQQKFIYSMCGVCRRKGTTVMKNGKVDEQLENQLMNIGHYLMNSK